VPEINEQHLKTLQVMAHQTEQLFNKDVQIGQLAAQNNALINAVRERDAELEKLRPKPVAVEVPKVPEPQAAAATTPAALSPSPAPSTEPSAAQPTSVTADSEGGEA
jgi:hypothetical protein